MRKRCKIRYTDSLGAGQSRCGRNRLKIEEPCSNEPCLLEICQIVPEVFVCFAGAGILLLGTTVEGYHTIASAVRFVRICWPRGSEDYGRLMLFLVGHIGKGAECIEQVLL